MDEKQREALAGKKVAELQTMAVEMGLAGKGLKKAQLIEAILTGPSGGNGSATATKTAAPRAPRTPRVAKTASADPAPETTTPAETTNGSAAPAEPAASNGAPAPAENNAPTGTNGSNGTTEAKVAAPARQPAPRQHQFEGRSDTEPRQPFRERTDRDRGGDRDRGRRRRGRDRGGREQQQRIDRPGDRQERQQQDRPDRGPREPEVINEADLEPATGILDTLPEGYGFLRTSNYLPTQEDVYVSLSQVRRFQLRRGDELVGMARKPKESEKYQALVRIDTINGKPPADILGRPWFDKLTPLYPEERIRMEVTDQPNEIAQRIIDLVAPIGKGQRGMIVSPPKAGKTTVMKQIANSIRANAPDAHLIVLLVDERPEEVTDMQRSVDGEIVYSTFDRPSDDHIQVTELTLDRAKRMVELGRDVVILLDGITRLSRAYNLATPASGRILSGGVDSTALYPPKRFFGAARNIEQGGSLTIIATALVETGSRMDEVIFEEFKGTGNWELKLDRRASEKRLFPAIDISSSGTRKGELLLTKEELNLVWKLRRVLHALDSGAGLELLIDKMRSTKGNLQFLMEVSKQSPGD
ncbi:MAG TPA: transcription termination factor Rho [Actinomycetota bacterium]|nr:transcription termination factor Rho [Actinomycetota bacterium]